MTSVVGEISCLLWAILLGLPEVQGRVGWAGSQVHPLSLQGQIPIDCVRLTWHILEEHATEGLKSIKVSSSICLLQRL